MSNEVAVDGQRASRPVTKTKGARGRLLKLVDAAIRGKF
jgi:hypothetical protein